MEQLIKKIDESTIEICGCKLKLIKEGDTIDTFDVEQYREYRAAMDATYDEDDAFDLEYPDPYDLLDNGKYQPKKWFDDFMSVATEEDDDYGTRYDVYTDYWYISLRKVADTTPEALNELADDGQLDDALALYDHTGELWLYETRED